MAKVLWKNSADEKEGVRVEKVNGETIYLRKGSFFTYKNRKPCVVRLEEFTQKDKSVGPIGLIYLPWRGGKWAEPEWGLRGNPRHIIAFPAGSLHYGEQIDWETIELCANPEEIK